MNGEVNKPFIERVSRRWHRRAKLADLIGRSEHGKMSYATNTTRLGRFASYFGGLNKPLSVAHRHPSPAFHFWMPICSRSSAALQLKNLHPHYPQGQLMDIGYHGYRRRTTTIIFSIWVHDAIRPLHCLQPLPSLFGVLALCNSTLCINNIMIKQQIIHLN